MIKALISIIYLSFTLPLVANIALDHPLSLVELVDIALENNPDTRQAWWNAHRAAASVGCAKSAYYPEIGLSANTRHGRDFQFTEGPNVNYTIFGLDLTLSMLLFDFGESSANVRATKMALAAAKWQENWLIQGVMIDVLEQAYSTLHAQEALKASLASLEDAKKMAEIACELNKVGLSPVSDVYISEAGLAQMKIDVVLQKAQLDIQRGRLAASLGLDLETLLEIAEIKLDEKVFLSKQNLASLIQLSSQKRADLMTKRAQVAESKARLDKTKMSSRPKVSISGRAGADHAYKDPASAGHYQIAINIAIPIFQGFDSIYRKRIAYADAQISQEELSRLELDIALEILSHSRTAEATHEMLMYAEDNYKHSLNAYEGTMEKYKAGKESIAEVSNAQRQLASSRLRYSEIKTRWLVSIANLAYSTGSIISHMESSCAQKAY